MQIRKYRSKIVVYILNNTVRVTINIYIVVN